MIDEELESKVTRLEKRCETLRKLAENGSMLHVYKNDYKCSRCGVVGQFDGKHPFPHAPTCLLRKDST